jgi:hypothetical protein
VELIKMNMHDVEFRGHPADFVQHNHVIGNDVLDAGIRPERLFAARNHLAAVVEFSLAKSVTS